MRNRLAVALNAGTVNVLNLTLAALLMGSSPSFADKGANTYPGVILSSNGSTVKKAAIHGAVASVSFPGLLSDRLSDGAVYVRERRLSALEEGMIAGRRSLCRTARIRRIIARAGGHLNCSLNYELSIEKIPNDPDFETRMWSLKFIAAPLAWDITTGTSDATVAVIDTGIQQTHPDLRSNLWVNTRETASNGIDDDLNGYIDDVHGVNTITGTGSGSDDNGHGTHVAGTIGAAGDNGIGVPGINWSVSLMAVKFLSSAGGGTTVNAIRSVEYVVAMKKAGHKIVAINSSWGGPSFSKPLLDSIITSGKEGILFVAAAGNDSANNDVKPTYPASYQTDNVISVASLDSGGALSSFSNFGARSVHIAAPGRGIYSTLISSTYRSLSGTSMAAPHVAGVAALVYAACPRLNSASMRQVILSQGTKNSGLRGRVVTEAHLSAANTLAASVAVCPSATPNPVPTGAPGVEPTSTPIPLTPTATPTPTNTPLPSDGYLFAEPSSFKAAKGTTLNISTGRGTNSAVSLKWVIYSDVRAPYACPGATIVSLPKGTRAINLKLPVEAKHFPSLGVSFSTLRKEFSSTLTQTDTEPTLVPSVMAARLCRYLTSNPYF